MFTVVKVQGLPTDYHPYTPLTTNIAPTPESDPLVQLVIMIKGRIESMSSWIFSRFMSGYQHCAMYTCKLIDV